MVLAGGQRVVHGAAAWAQPLLGHAHGEGRRATLAVRSVASLSYPASFEGAEAKNLTPDLLRDQLTTPVP